MHWISLDDGTRARSTGSLLYVPDDGKEEKFPGAYQETSRPGVAWRIVGEEIEVYEDWDDDLSPGSERWRPTGRVIAVMVGDDHRFAFDQADLKPIARGVCGQIGCTHDGLDR